MTPLYKLREIENLMINFDGIPGKLEPIARQIDLLGSMISYNTKAYKKLGDARRILQRMVDSNKATESKIIKVIELLSQVENILRN